MLHERRLPAAIAADLDRAYQVNLQFLTWLLRTPPQHLDDKSPLTAQFNPSLATWFWRRIQKPKNKPTAFRKAVQKLIDAAKNDPKAAAGIADKIVHDSEFHQHWPTTGFGLEFPVGHSTWSDLIGNVAVPFYDWLSSESGFDAATFGLTEGTLTRAAIMAAYRSQSFGVCGYCDGPLGEMGTKHEANDCDHFFPKASWPHLAIHPANLFAVCKGCNSTWKGEQAPMRIADAAGLHGTYHPMFRPGAQQIVVTAGSATGKPRNVEIAIADPVCPQRAETLDQTLDLKARWTNDVNEQLDKSVSVLVAKTVHDRFLGRHPSEQDVRDAMQSDIAWKKSRIGKEERTLRLIAAMQFQLGDHMPQIVAELQ